MWYAGVGVTPCMAAFSPEEFADLIRENLPALLRQHGEFRYEIMGILADVFATKDDLKTILEEIKALREDAGRRFEAAEKRFEAMDKRFEAMDKRFEAMDKRFEATIAELKQHREDTNRRFEAVNSRLDEHTAALRELRLEVSALSGRLGHGVEDIVRQTVEKFSGQKFKEMKHLKIKDETGELYGVPAEIEYDLYLADTVNYVVEVKSHAKSGDVLNFYRKKVFAESKLGKPLKGVLISASIDRAAKKKCQELGLDLICRSVI